MSQLADRLTAAGFGAGWSLVKTMPEPVADRIFRQAADTAFRRRGPSVVQLAKNLHRVLGEQSTPESLSAVVQAGMRSYARYWKETFRLPAMDHDEVFAQLEATVIGAEHIERAVAEGRGIMLPVTALRELGHRRPVGDPPLGHDVHRRRTAQAGIVVREVRRLPGIARHGDPAADRRRRRRPRC